MPAGAWCGAITGSVTVSLSGFARPSARRVRQWGDGCTRLSEGRRMPPPTLVEELEEPYGIRDSWRLARLTRLWQVYETRGLVREGAAVSLHRDCRNADRCWAGREPPSGRGPTIHLPWVGAGYEEAATRVLVVAMNLRIADEDADPFVQLDIVTNQVLPRFRRGTERGDPAFFPFHSPAWQAASRSEPGPRSELGFPIRTGSTLSMPARSWRR